MDHEIQDGLQLSEEEAYAILTLCLTSPQALDATSEKAIRKLAAYCTAQRQAHSHHKENADENKVVKLELNRAGM